jgi:trimeric autotransporter adhesin
VTFSATGLPAGANPTFNPTSVTPGSPTIMTVTTTARPMTAATETRPANPRGLRFPKSFQVWLCLLALTMLLAGFGFAGPERKALRRLAPVTALILVIIAAGYLAGCAGGFPQLETATPPSGTPAGTFTITVTGTSGTDVHSTTVTLTVQ